ncbi:MAG: phosphoenolpyruvate--protein phosphotransferase [Leptospirales bacterium]|nr:phosphoenolpyruvate--protein phosphotransferase [Leptospirales bacterium]
MPGAVEIVLRGAQASGGIARGALYPLHDPLLSLPHQSIDRDAVEAEIERLHLAMRQSRSQLEAILAHTRISPELQAIFEAQALMFEDPMLISATEDRIRSRAINAEWALAVEIENIKGFLEKSNNEIIRERSADVNDAGLRLLGNLMGVPGGDLRLAALQQMPAGAVVAAHEVSPAMMLELRNCAAIVTEGGGVAGHMAILARSRGLPALVNVEGLMDQCSAGWDALVDGERGELVIHPGEQRLTEWRAFQARQVRRAQEHVQSPVQTQDGESIRLFLNLSDDQETDASLGGASGVGLFRTEFLYLGDSSLLHEDERQTERYRDLLQRLSGGPVTLRLMDVSEDKRFPLYTDERDLRGVRFLLANRELLLRQLRSILEAAAVVGRADGSVRIMAPLVARVDEMQAVREALQEAQQSLQKRGIEAPRIELGMMLETPAAALMADVFSEVSDFFSIGSNDLGRYTMALAREQATDLELFYQPAVFRMIHEALRRATKPVSLCGELAARRGAREILLGLGLRDLSVAPASLRDLCAGVRDVSLRYCKSLAEQALAARDAAELCEHLGL